MRVTCLLTLALSAMPLLGCRATAPPPQSLSAADWEERVSVGVVPSGVVSAEDEEAANRAVEEKLQMQCTINFEGNTLGSVLDFVRDVSGVSMAVNWDSFDIVGIDPDLPITLQLDQVSVAQLLSIVLEQASAEQFDGDKAGYTVYQGAVVIDTQTNIKQYTVLHVYDARLLIEADRWEWVSWFSDSANEEELKKFIEAWEPHGYDLRHSSDALGLPKPGIGVGGGNGGGGGGGPGGGGGRFSGGDLLVDSNVQATDAQLARKFRSEIFRWLIEDTVGDPYEWLDEESTIHEIDGFLVVKTTRENQRAIRALLIELYKKQAELSE